MESKSHLGTPLAKLTLRQQYNSQKVYKRAEKHSIIVHVIIQPQAVYAGFTRVHQQVDLLSLQH